MLWCRKMRLRKYIELRECILKYEDRNLTIWNYVDKININSFLNSILISWNIVSYLWFVLFFIRSYFSNQITKSNLRFVDIQWQVYWIKDVFRMKMRLNLLPYKNCNVFAVEYMIVWQIESKSTSRLIQINVKFSYLLKKLSD